MSILIRLASAVMLIAAIGGCATGAQHPDAKAAMVLEGSKAASGGAAWDGLAGSYEEGVHNGSPYRTWMDFRAYGRRVEAQSGPVKMMLGYNGTIAWRKVGDELTTMTDEAALSEARISAFVSNNGFYFPDRFPAKATYVRNAKEEEGNFDVIEIAPEGARAVRLWFDRRTHLLARIEDFAGAPPVTVRLSDYRRVDGVLIAFAGVVTDNAGKVVDRGSVGTVVHRPVSRSVFEPGGSGE